MAIAKLSIDIEARLANFEKSLDKVAAATESRAQKMAKAFDQVGQAVGTIAAGLSVGAFTAMVTNVSQAAEEVSKLSKLSGVGAEEFQRYAYAAQSVGFQSEKMADIFKDVNDKVGDFLSTGGGPLKDFFENIAPRVGVAAEAFKNLSGPQALQLYFDSLQKANVSQSEMTFYMEALANDATALAPLLANNGAEFKRLGDDAERFGAVLSENVIGSSREFNENLRATQAVLGSLAKDVAASAIPIFNEVAEQFLKTQEKAEGMSMAGNVAKTVFEALVVAGANVAYVLKQTGNEIGGIAAQLGALARGDFQGFSAIGEMMKEDAAVARKELDEFEKRIFGIAEKAPKIAQAAFTGTGAGRAAAVKEGRGGRGSGGSESRSSFEDYDARILRQVASAITDNDVTRAQDLAAQIAKLDELYFDAGLSAEYYEAAMRKITGMESSDGLKKQTEELSKQKSLAEELGLTFTSAFEDAIAGGKGFSDVLKGLESDILRLLTRLAVTEPLGKALSGGKSGGGIDWGGLVDGVVKYFTAKADGGVYSSPSLSAYSGGVYSSPQLFAFANGAGVFGEAGPEAIMPLKRGKDGKLGVTTEGMGGGVTVNVINNTDAQTRTEKRSDGRGGSIIEVIVERVTNRLTSDVANGNGSFPATMQSTYGLKRTAGAY